MNLQALHDRDIDTARPLDGPTSSLRKKFKIALLGYRSDPFVGGQGIYLYYLSRALADLGHEVHVYSGQPYPQLDARIKLIPVPGLNLYAEPRPFRALRWHHLRSFSDLCEWWSKISGTFAEPYVFGRRVKKMLAHQNYDVIHDNQSLCSAMIDLQRAGALVVSTIHHPVHRDRDIALQSEKRAAMRYFIRRWYSFIAMQEKTARKLRHIVTVSENSRRDIAHYFHLSEKCIEVIYNGVDTELFKPLRDVQRVPFRLMTTTSSDHPLKGLKNLLHALRLLREKYPSASLQIVGKLKPNGDCDTFIREHGLTDAVECVANIANHQLCEHYNRAHVFVCPSLYEGFGLPLAEAMACATACVCTDGGALPEVAGAAALIARADSADDLAQKIALIFDDESRCRDLELRSRERMLRVFSWSGVAAQLSAYYERIGADANR